MRRRLGIFIPIVLLAILVQLIAPISLFRVVANAISDPLYMATICSGMASGEHSPADRNGEHDHGDCCSVCGAGLSGAVAVNAPPLIFVTLQRQFQRVTWLEAAHPTPATRVGSNAQARAPPQAS
jgi:hypothetical protein